jgi:hypothetical protein
MSAKALRILIYGPSKVGKSRLAETAPGPRLIIDTELRTDFLKNPMIQWTNVNNPPPSDLGKNDSVILECSDWATFQQAHNWLKSGKHPFKSVVVDSLSELQKRLKDKITKGVASKLQFDAWGELLMDMDLTIRQFRDLTRHKTNPLLCVVITALVDDRSAILRPYVEGSLRLQLAGVFDVVGYMRPVLLDEETGEVGRELAIASHPGYEAGDGTDLLIEKWGAAIPSPNLMEMMKAIQPPKEKAA